MSLKIWHCRIPHHLAREKVWSTDSRDNFDSIEVWAASREQAKLIGAYYISKYSKCQPHEVVVRRNRLMYNPRLLTPPKHPRKVIEKEDYVEWQTRQQSA